MISHGLMLLSIILSQVLEDDVVMRDADHVNLRETVHTLLSELPSAWDICFLGYASLSYTHPSTKFKRKGICSVKSVLGAFAYVVNAKALPVLLFNLPVDAPVDCFLSRLIGERPAAQLKV
jgi:GR25 family glycosyltransferase involved in LPS biosynthesis